MRPHRMARDHGLLPRGERRIKLFQRGFCLRFDPRDFVRDGGRATGRENGAQFVGFGVNFSDGFFKIEIGAH